MVKVEALNLFGDLEQKTTGLVAEPTDRNPQVFVPMFQVRLDANVGDDLQGIPSRYWRVRVVQRYGKTREGMKYIIERVEARTDFENVSIEPENNGLLIA